MKKARRLVALTVATSVTLSAAVPVFASPAHNSPQRFATGAPRSQAPVAEEQQVEETAEYVAALEEAMELFAAANAPNRFATGTPRVAEAAPAPAEVVEEAPVVFADLAFTTRAFLDHDRAVIGRIPVLTGIGGDFARLNHAFFTNIFRAHWNATDGAFTAGFDRATVEFTVEDFGRFAVVTQTIDFGGATTRAIPRHPSQTFVYHIDKGTNTWSTEANFSQYLANIAAEEADELEGLELEQAEVVEEEEVADEVEDTEEAEETEEA
ncbi:MAG: hypothetical protein FWD96_04535, partial [Defluviitaleaceae bacterium]|nr:hypothetical protein [Defluviitaleaceae bacterium]